MIFHEPFLGIIGNETSGKYKDPTHHPFHQKITSVPAKNKNSMKTFRKWQNEDIGGFNKENWLEVDVSRFSLGYSKSYINSPCLIRVIDEQGESIGRLHQTIKSA